MTITVPTNFDSKEIYVQFRKEWKARYKELSQEIRGHRQWLKTCQRKGTASCQEFRNVWYAVLEARQMMEALEKAKFEVRRHLRSLGINAPEPKVREKPAPRLKKRWTPEQIAEARYCFEVRGADGHND